MRKKLCFLLMFPVLCVCMSLNAAAFSDVDSGAWYAEAVDYVVENGLFQGTGDDIFSPDGTMNRAMFMTVLGRMAGVTTELTTAGTITKTSVNIRTEPNTTSEVVDMADIGDAVEVSGHENGWYRVNYNGEYGYIRDDLMTATVDGLDDVAYTEYYAPYVAWAYRCGITYGTGLSTFSPDLPITREEICICLARYCEYYGLELPQLNEPVQFTDEDQLKNPDAVHELQCAGIIEGRNDGSFDPGASVTRSEVAALIQRFKTADVTVSVPEEPESSYDGYEVDANIPPLSDAVDEDWFDDACFIGHSLVVGMQNYLGLPNADYYAVSGISALGLLDYDLFPLDETYIDENGDTVCETSTIADVLAERSYGKVYIMLGVNELGPETDHWNMFYSAMLDLIDIVEQTQPDAEIYLISITPVTCECSDSSVNFNRRNVLRFNEALQQVSRETGAYYLDAFGAYCDEEGYMPAECVLSDGIHILADCYSVMRELIMTHTA